MSTFERSVRLTVLGWTLVVVFAVLVALGPDSVLNAAIFAVIGAVMGAWVWLRRSRPASVVSLVIGVLLSIEQVGYVVADLSDGEVARGGADLLGLVAGLVVVLGSVLALRTSRSRGRLDASVT